MKTIRKVGIMLCLGAAFSYAETWTGKLMDASCYDTQKAAAKAHENLTKTCAPTAATTDFAIKTSAGKVYKVNSAGNAALATDIRNGTLKADKDGDMHASVTGSRDGDVVNVDSVNLTKKEK